MNDDMMKNKNGVEYPRADIIAALREFFPHGHEDYLPIAVREMQLHSDKNHDYAKGGSPLGNFTRVAALLALYPGLNPADPRVVALTYALKQLDAVLWGMAKGIVHRVEGLNERLQDISVYAKIVMCMNLEAARNKAIDEQFGVDLPAKESEPAYRARREAEAMQREKQEQERKRQLEPKPYAGSRGSFATIDETRPAKCPDLNTTRDYADEAREGWLGRAVAVDTTGVHPLNANGVCSQCHRRY